MICCGNHLPTGCECGCKTTSERGYLCIISKDFANPVLKRHFQLHNYYHSNGVQTSSSGTNMAKLGILKNE